jgi:hypothetical protein
MSAKVTTYKNSPILMLQNEKFPMALGVAKSKLILEHIDDIRQFVVENDKPKGDKNA